MQPSGCSFGARMVPGKTILTEDPRGCVDQFPPTAVQLILLKRCPKMQSWTRGAMKTMLSWLIFFRLMHDGPGCHRSKLRRWR